jgi:hypothetical protein
LTLFFYYSSCADIPEINQEERKNHQCILLAAMTRFAKTLETNSKIQFERSPKKQTHIRLNPGNSAWSILLTMYIFSDDCGNGEFQKEDILKNTESLKNVT